MRILIPALLLMLLAPRGLLIASDHIDGPRTVNNPAADLTDLFAFPSPNTPGHLTVILNVHTGVAYFGHFSDKVTYRFLIRRAKIRQDPKNPGLADREKPGFETSGDYFISCTFETPHGLFAPHFVNCISSKGTKVHQRVDEVDRGAPNNGLRVFAGRRSDPFFFDAQFAKDAADAAATKIPKTHKSNFIDNNVMHNLNILSIVVDIDIEKELGAGEGSLFAVAAETTTTQDELTKEIRRIDRIGRPEITNVSLALRGGRELRDLYNAETPFAVPTNAQLYRERLRGNIDHYDKLDNTKHWDPKTADQLVEILLDDFQVVDVSKPFGDDTYFEIERSILQGKPHSTCGGRAPNDDVMDVLFGLFIKAGIAPVDDGVDEATRKATNDFPYLAEPNDGILPWLKSFFARAVGKLSLSGFLFWVGVVQLTSGIAALLGALMLAYYGVRLILAKIWSFAARSRIGSLRFGAVAFAVAIIFGLYTHAFSVVEIGVLLVLCIATTVRVFHWKKQAKRQPAEPPSRAQEPMMGKWISRLVLVGAIAAVAFLVWRQRAASVISRDPNVTIDAADAFIPADDPFDPVPKKVVYVPQNWNPTARAEFYTKTQGSRLLPLEWFRKLEQFDAKDPAKEQALFSDNSNINRYRYLPQKNALPVGFAIDPANNKSEDSEQKQDWVGLTCAACHTGQIHHNGIAYRIDGGPAMADHDTFLIDLTAAMRATLDVPARFDRFANQVLGKNAAAEKIDALRAQLKRQTERRESYNERNASYVAENPVKKKLDYGYARLDAFGRIMNEVMTRFIGETNDNAKSANAPVSYPYLWDTHQQDVVQWNGVADNHKPLGRLGRNVGEVLGVFGAVEIPAKDPIDPRFPSSVNFENLHHLEQNLVANLWSPRWPTALGELDAKKVADGKVLFEKKCATCHDPAFNTEDPDRSIETVRIFFKKGGDDVNSTDPLMAVNFAERRGRPKNLAGRWYFDPRDGLIEIPKDDAKAVNMLVAMVNGAILGIEPGQAHVLLKEGELSLKEKIDQIHKSIVDEKFDELFSPQKKFLQRIGNPFDGRPDKKEEVNLLRYKSRPLNGIWATAPYLHNGSAPNLWELLKAPKDRVKTFKTGSREFDPKLVGFKTDGYNGFDFDATLPGNQNIGHDYGVGGLTDDQRWALIEYMKSL